jgi:hypothetical protein
MKEIANRLAMFRPESQGNSSAGRRVGVLSHTIQK